jgi:hypothetical protein
VISISGIIVHILIINLNLATQVFHDRGNKKTSYMDIAGISFAPSFPLLANTGGTSTFETERSKTKREGMETASASWLTANYDDSKKVWPSLLPLLSGTFSFRGVYCIPLPDVCFRTGLKGKFIP